MMWRWPWRRREPPGNGQAAAAAKEESRRRERDQRRRWPEALEARDELAKMAERAMRGLR